MKKRNALWLSFVIFFAMCLTFGLFGTNTPHRIPGLVLMFCSGFFAEIGLFFLAILWFFYQSSEKNNALRKSVVLSVVLCLIIGLVSLNMPHIDSGRVLMACAGFFAGIALSLPAITGYSYKPKDNESHQNYSMKI
ncbi:MAG: hypothetical protein WC271_04680 [Bacteroidales bacterium]|jgi:hypothetical protein|nr:hypothetical protein [Bacteroidales bacterium]NCU36182.1 hypothetical protein [Candidatus Falkowbacteria bacterium]MDD2631825.1 hypothetical protein [Bacteroidales bacterium]MDD3131769.1 hypothetical protein [Bacteroidales bacterium]MDD4177882.1 hypothetical protein [Bacteroidales bacterium]